VNLGTEGLGLLVAEGSERDSSPTSGGGGEEGLLCAGENKPVSEVPGILVVG
jgi:hypothetical protein